MLLAVTSGQQCNFNCGFKLEPIFGKSKLVPERDKIWLDRPDLMGLTDPVSWADEELAQLSQLDLCFGNFVSLGCR